MRAPLRAGGMRPARASHRCYRVRLPDEEVSLCIPSAAPSAPVTRAELRELLGDGAGVGGTVDSILKAPLLAVLSPVENEIATTLHLIAEVEHGVEQVEVWQDEDPHLLTETVGFAIELESKHARELLGVVDELEEDGVLGPVQSVRAITFADLDPDTDLPDDPFVLTSDYADVDAPWVLSVSDDATVTDEQGEVHNVWAQHRRLLVLSVPKRIDLRGAEDAAEALVGTIASAMEREL